MPVLAEIIARSPDNWGGVVWIEGVANPAYAFSPDAVSLQRFLTLQGGLLKKKRAIGKGATIFSSLPVLPRDGLPKSDEATSLTDRY